MVNTVDKGAGHLYVLLILFRDDWPARISRIGGNGIDHMVNNSHTLGACIFGPNLHPPSLVRIINPCDQSIPTNTGDPCRPVITK